MTKWLLKLWEIPDHIPRDSSTAVVCMCLALNKDGTLSPGLKSIVATAATCCSWSDGTVLIFSNRHTVQESNVARMERTEAIRLGIPERSIIIPKFPEKPRIRNTFEEAKFALRILRYRRDKTKQVSLVIVANHLHMRRVLSAYRKLGSDKITLYWKSAPGLYGPGTAQRRFMHPIFFAAYEMAAMVYSKLTGWA